ncbi:MAG: glycosyltransferase [Bacillota bacterium]
MFQRPQQLLSRVADLGYSLYYCNATQRPGMPPTPQGERVWIVHDFPAFIDSWDFTLPTVFWASWPGHCTILDWLRSKSVNGCLVVYDAVDYFPQWQRFEAQMIATADLIIAASKPLCERLLECGKPIFLIGNGADFSLFSRAAQGILPVPREMAHISPPVIGFVGALGPWLDVDLLAALGREAERLGWTVVLVGPPFGAHVPQMKSIVSVGYKPYHELPCYIARFNVCILPFDKSPTAAHSNPIKLYEYLASGKPVVATDIPEALHLKDLVWVARNVEEFLSLIGEAVANPPKNVADRLAFAMANSWETRASQVHQAITSVWQQRWGRHILV